MVLLVGEEDVIRKKQRGDFKDIGHVLFIKLGGEHQAVWHRWSFKNYSLK